ncbi:MAG: CcmD family protein [Gemmatimonadetes bacterium]|nr:CcmD family protein [Gemmatimonadota bacterium]
MPEFNNAFIIAAFTVTWLAVGGYAVRLRRARRAAESRVASARAALGGGS